MVTTTQTHHRVVSRNHSPRTVFCFSVYSYSHSACTDYGGVHFDRFPSAACVMAARCKLSFAFRPGLSQGDMKRTKGRRKKERKKYSPTLVLFRGCHERGRGEKQRLFLTFGTQLLGLRPPLLLQFPPFTGLPL